MKLISFQLSGRYGHFLKAEGAASALSYPVPPRTVILGIMGAVLGLSKDEPQMLLEPAHIALCGKIPETHWHRVKLRKDPPVSLPLVVYRKQKENAKSAPEKPTLLLQEWLFKPDYTVWVSMPEPYLSDLEKRLAERRWHFQPSLGLSEMMAELKHLTSGEAMALPEGKYPITNVFSPNDAELNMDNVFEHNLAIHALRMPRSLTCDRVFSHAPYYLERNARTVYVKTEKAFSFENEVLMFL